MVKRGGARCEGERGDEAPASIAAAAALLLGSTEPAETSGSAASCASALERIDHRLDRCAGRCIKGATSERDSCASRCQEIADSERDVALARPSCEALSDLMNTPAEARALAAIGGTSTGLWCVCKLDCDNEYSGMPALIKPCKELCDKQNKCRKGSSGLIGTTLIR